MYKILYHLYSKFYRSGFTGKTGCYDDAEILRLRDVNIDGYRVIPKRR